MKKEHLSVMSDVVSGISDVGVASFVTVVLATISTATPFGAVGNVLCTVGASITAATIADLAAKKTKHDIEEVGACFLDEGKEKVVKMKTVK